MSFEDEDLFQKNIQLPVRQFMFTIDQIAHMLNCKEETLYSRYLFYVGRDHGQPRGRLRAVNIAPGVAGVQADWRVTEQDFIFWLKQRGITFKETLIPLRRRPNQIRRDR